MFNFNSLLLFLFLISGFFIGSFLNVVIDRLPRGETFSIGRSHCDSCHKTLQWYDLIPLVSFIYLRGKCRYCNKPIGWQTITVEILTGCLFALTVYFNPITIALNDFFWLITLIYYLFVVSCFIIITIIDIKHGIIPNRIVYSAIVVSLIFHIMSPLSILPYFVSALTAGFFFFFLFAVTKGRGMGFGDVKLAILLGLFLGFPGIIVALYIAFLTGATVALILVIGRKKSFVGGTIPFGPFLVFGAIIAFYYADIFWRTLHFFAFL